MMFLHDVDWNMRPQPFAIQLPDEFVIGGEFNENAGAHSRTQHLVFECKCKIFWDMFRIDVEENCLFGMFVCNMNGIAIVLEDVDVVGDVDTGDIQVIMDKWHPISFPRFQLKIVKRLHGTTEIDVVENCF